MRRPRQLQGHANSSACPLLHRLGSILGQTLLLLAVGLGLLGPLVLSLTILAVVQLPPLLALRDTPLPLLLALALGLVPMAFVLKKVLEMTKYRSALHLARLMQPPGDLPVGSPNRMPDRFGVPRLRGHLKAELQTRRSARDLTWHLSTSGKFWTVVLLFVWAYWDLTASSILAPIGMTPVTVRLYNLMHYGQVAALSAMTCATFAAPILILLLALGTRRWWAPR